MENFMYFQNVLSKRRFTVFLSFLFLAATTIFFNACKKDSLISGNDPTISSKDVITVNEAKNWFVNQYGEKHTIHLSQSGQTSFSPNGHPTSLSDVIIAPTWTDAAVSKYLNSSPILIVPVQHIESLNMDGSGYSLVFYRDTTLTLKTRLQIYIPDTAYLKSHEQFSVNDFSGIMHQLDMEGKGRRFFLIENGKFVARGYATRPAGSLKVRLEGDDEDVCLDGGPDCPSPAGIRRGRFSRLIGSIVNFFSGGSSSSSSNSSGSSSASVFGSSSNGSLFGDISISSGGGNSIYLSNEIDNTLFSQYPGRSYVFSLNLTEDDKNYLRTNGNVWDQISDFCTQNKRATKYEKEELISQQLELMRFDNRYSDANQQAGFPSFGGDQWEEDVVKPFFGPELMLQYTVWCAILKHQNPTWPAWKIRTTAFWNTTKEIIHTGLDICGLIPAAGEPCDLVNGVFYTIEGDGLNATLSFAATIPIAGWVAMGSKYAIKTIGVSGRTYKLGYKVINGIIEFGDKDVLRAQLRKVLNLTVGDGKRAHHMIPLELTENADLREKATKLIQKAAEYKAAFHPK